MLLQNVGNKKDNTGGASNGTVFILDFVKVRTCIINFLYNLKEAVAAWGTT
jgi:hypothetical protein